MDEEIKNYNGLKLEICQIKDLKVGDSFIESIKDKNFFIFKILHIYDNGRVSYRKLTCMSNYGGKICLEKRNTGVIGKLI